MPVHHCNCPCTKLKAWKLEESNAVISVSIHVFNSHQLRSLSLSANIIVLQEKCERAKKLRTDILIFLIYMYHFYFHIPRMGGFSRRGGMCVCIYTCAWLYGGPFLSWKLRCQFALTFPFLITRWIWFLGRSDWLQWLQPDISQCQAFPRITLPMSLCLDLETPSAIPSPQWKLKNVLTLKSPLCTDLQYSGI